MYKFTHQTASMNFEYNATVDTIGCCVKYAQVWRQAFHECAYVLERLRSWCNIYAYIANYTRKQYSSFDINW